MNRVLLFDTFSYNGEPVVELRLQHLAEHVDMFIIVEARHTHSGALKDELFIHKYASTFEPYKNKIQFIVIDEFPPMPADWVSQHGDASYMREESYESWYRERYQRDIARDYLLANFAQTEYMVMCTDADEIVDANIVKNLRSQYFAFRNPVYLEMKFYYYHFEWQKKFPWYMAYIVNDLGLQRASLSHFRTNERKVQVMQNAGWHCSYFLDVANLQRKLESFAHRECDTSMHKTKKHLMKCLTEGKDISGRAEAEDCVKADVSTLPPAFQEFQKKLLFLQRYSSFA